MSMLMELIVPIASVLAASSGLVDLIRSWVKRKDDSDEDANDEVKNLVIESDSGRIEINFSVAQEKSILDALRKIEEVSNGKVTESK